jgi:beta-lactamase regulating signal transducer with metallopeptidase domain
MEALNMQLSQLFEWLLWTTIQGSILIGLIVLVQIILRRKLPIRWHYFLWLLLLIRLAIPWAPKSKISVFNLVPQSIQRRRIIESISKSYVDDIGYCSSTESTSVQKTETHPVVAANNGTAQSQPQTAQETVPKPTAIVKPAVSDTPFANLKDFFKSVIYRFLRMLPIIWLVGAVVMAGYVFARNLSLWLTVKRERPITDQKVLELLEDCKIQMGVQTILGVVVSDRVKSPALFGFVRPRLLLPQGMLETYSLEELRYVFMHELAHLRQRDIYLGWLMSLLQIMHWFNPLMWIAFNRMRTDRELACDRLAISVMGPDEPPRYGQTIVNLVESFSQVSYVPSVAGILEDTSQIERRIKMIVGFKKASRIWSVGAVFVLAILACVVLTNAYVVRAPFDFGTPTNLGPPFNTEALDGTSCISADGLEIIFESERPGGSGGSDLWVAKRTSTEDKWGPAVNLGQSINSSVHDWGPSISTDGLELYFQSRREGGLVGSSPYDIWMTTRTARDGEWGEPVNLCPTVNTPHTDAFPCISADGLSLYFMSDRPGGLGEHDIWVSTRTTKNGEWGEPVNLGPVVNSSRDEIGPAISPDGLTLFFSSGYPLTPRPGGFGRSDLWMTRRAGKNQPWGKPVNLGPNVNTPANEVRPNISADGSTLYFCSTRPGGAGNWDIWQVSILRIQDELEPNGSGDGSKEPVQSYHGKEVLPGKNP